jgi:hypothetical protein
MKYIKIGEGCYKKVSGYTGFYGLFQAIKHIKAIFFSLSLQSYEKAEKIENIYSEVVSYNKEVLNGLQ